MVHAVSDVGSNAEENIDHAARIIGRSRHRYEVFRAIYTGKRRAKTVSQLILATKLPQRRVLDAGKKLADNNLVKTLKIGGETAYEKIGFFQSHKKRILSLASSPEKLKNFPTKRNTVRPSIKVRMSGARARIRQIAVDDVDSFRLVRGLPSRDEIGNSMSETAFKMGMKRILGEGGQFKDWGGEMFDLFTTRGRVNGRRRTMAFALKGPATKGKLTPGKMGKNGDQIQRLFEAPAEVFFVQYCRQIEATVLTQMKYFAIAKSLMTGDLVYYGVIDGADSERLVSAYPMRFKSARRKRN